MLGSGRTPGLPPAVGVGYSYDIFRSLSPGPLPGRAGGQSRGADLRACPLHHYRTLTSDLIMSDTSQKLQTGVNLRSAHPRDKSGRRHR